MRGRGFRRASPPGGGRMPQGDKPGSGIGGRCVCPKCGYSITHNRATPCNLKSCPKCGTKLIRE